MASEMVRPDVLSFIENMEFDRVKNYSFDEIIINEKFTGKSLADLHLNDFTDTLIIALVSNGEWTYLPKPDLTLKKPSKLIVITSVSERKKLAELT